MSSLRLNRRMLLAGAGAGAAALALPRQAFAQGNNFTIVAHAVHQRAATDGPGGNILAEWPDGQGLAIEWLTYGVVPLHEQLFREASLNEGNVDVAFVLNRFTDETVMQMFEPLDPFQAADPIAEFEGLSAGMRAAFTFGGNLLGVPFRHATHGLHFNEEILAERGFDRPPETFEEVIEYARALTFTRDNGTQVHGFLVGGQGPANIMDVVRAYGGDFITEDFQLKANEKGMVDAVTLLADFYKAGVLPQIFLNFTTEDVITFMQQGRAAMAISPFDRFTVFNDPASSQHPGKIGVKTIPGFAALADTVPVVPAKTEIWSLAIPKNARNKERAWSFIKHLSSPDATVREALNGNGPVRPAAYDDPRVREQVPFWEAARDAVDTALVPLPGFRNSARVDDMVKEEVQAALLGAKTPQQAMDDLQRRVTPLLPRS